MHMADALVSPAVGGIFWAASAYLTAKSSAVAKNDNKSGGAALMGVLAAFVFASQMINFSIPGTGSSGHIGGGLLLAILLGPERAFLSMVSILTVQALFFADGGLLALGCNIFNMGFFPCFIAYPYVYKKITERVPGSKGIMTGAVMASMAGLVMGAFFVVLQTTISGITSLPAGVFMMLMLPVHFVIGAVEGFATAMVIIYVYARMPEVFNGGSPDDRGVGMKRAVAVFSVLALLTGGFFAWYASSSPDGLEWSILNVTGTTELDAPQTHIHALFSSLQDMIAPLPDYSIKGETYSENMGTTVSGIVGSIITLTFAVLMGMMFSRRKSRQ
ncbi:MAG TPA: energy-coupling factor ABC transporter permease [Synergistaceae bacterium]|nr:energy-coupling factor ABC transporter permease [Synergistaceae bacterium]NLL40589.1 cobalamin biosynthesis protein CbiM [Synergistaceae bacterium]HPX02922.1 energy-coupling factor ABC transporter permease [Synergistaceae bacterium]HQA54149.1 energy-coupling factor ABC transporter permease [Synergistaceae bacterium]